MENKKATEEIHEAQWQTIETVYKTDSEKLTRQLGFILIIRGWAITLFAGIFTASVAYKIPELSIVGVIVLLVFFYAEATYDAYRVLLLKRINEIERNFLSKRVADLEIKLNLKERALSKSFPLFIEAEKLPDNLRDATKYASKRPVRFCTYLLLISVLVLYEIITRLQTYVTSMN